MINGKTAENIVDCLSSAESTENTQTIRYIENVECKKDLEELTAILKGLALEMLKAIRVFSTKYPKIDITNTLITTVTSLIFGGGK